MRYPIPKLIVISLIVCAVISASLLFAIGATAIQFSQNIAMREYMPYFVAMIGVINGTLGVSLCLIITDVKGIVKQ